VAVHLSEWRDAQRLLAAIAAAVLVHVGLYFGIPFLTSLDTAPLPDYGPIVVTLEEPLAAVEPPPRPPAPVPRPTPAPAARPALAPAVRPAPAPGPAASAAAAPKLAVDAGAARAPARAPGASAFQQSGATTGTSAGPLTDVRASPPKVDVPVQPSAPAYGSGLQRKGEAVIVSERQTAGSTGALDIPKLDQSPAAAPTGGTGTAAATGSGTSAGAAGDIEWENPDAAKGREPRSNPQVELSDEVRKQSLLPPEVTVVITVDENGVVSSAAMVRTSGIRAFDNACIAAVYRVRFSAAPGAAPITGRWTFRIVR
jgi:TonB family protein